MTDVKKFLLGSMLVSGLALGGAGCKNREQNKDDKEETKTENMLQDTNTAKNDPYGNVALFEESCSKIKFALALVENYYPYTYNDDSGKGTWTTGEGITKLYDEHGKAKPVTQDTKPVTASESDVYKWRFLTYDILPKIKQAIKVPTDENVLIAECVLGYCVGPQWIVDSEFTKQLNAGKTGAELANYLTGFRNPNGVPKRMYFLAALVAGKVQWSDLLDLRAEGCYNLTWQDIFVCDKNGEPIKKNNFCKWDFSKLKQNIEKAKKPKSTKLYLKGGETVTVKCELAKDFVPDYVWQDVSTDKAGLSKDTIAFSEANADAQNDISFIAYQNGDYEKALKAGKFALKLAETNKQHGAATYNIGISYLAMGKYSRAIKYLEQSIAFNKTNAAQQKLDEAIRNQQERRTQNRRTAGYVALGALGAGVAYGIKKKYYSHNQKHR